MPKINAFRKRHQTITRMVSQLRITHTHSVSKFYVGHLTEILFAIASLSYIFLLGFFFSLHKMSVIEKMGQRGKSGGMISLSNNF